MTTTDDYTVGPVPDQHRDIFNAMTSGDYSNFALMSVHFDDIETSAIITVNDDGQGMYDLRPIAVMLTPEMEDRLRDPHGDAPQELT